MHLHVIFCDRRFRCWMVQQKWLDSPFSWCVITFPPFAPHFKFRPTRWIGNSQTLELFWAFCQTARPHSSSQSKRQMVNRKIDQFAYGARCDAACVYVIPSLFWLSIRCTGALISRLWAFHSFRKCSKHHFVMWSHSDRKYPVEIEHLLDAFLHYNFVRGARWRLGMNGWLVIMKYVRYLH